MRNDRENQQVGRETAAGPERERKNGPDRERKCGPDREKFERELDRLMESEEILKMHGMAGRNRFAVSFEDVLEQLRQGTE